MFNDVDLIVCIKITNFRFLNYKAIIQYNFLKVYLSLIIVFIFMRFMIFKQLFCFDSTIEFTATSKKLL